MTSILYIKNINRISHDFAQLLQHTRLNGHTQFYVWIEKLASSTFLRMIHVNAGKKSKWKDWQG